MPIDSGINASGYLWTGWSYLQFYPSIPDFYAPSGVFLHKESYKLLPNYALPTHTEFPTYKVERGGSYPSASINNVFNVYLNIIWSADCGGAKDCI